MKDDYDPNTADFLTLTKQFFIRGLIAWNSRCTRREYWLGQLGLLAAFLLFLIPLYFMFPDWVSHTRRENTPYAEYTIMNWLFEALTFIFIKIPHIGALVRRLHDIGKRVWWGVPFVVVNYVDFTDNLWGTLISFAICVFTFILCCRDSEREPNAWGPSPKYRKASRSLS